MKSLALILAFAAAALAQTPALPDATMQAYIDEHLQAQRLIDGVEPDAAGQCEEYREGRKVAYGDLNHDGSADAALLYTLEGGGLGNNAAQYLAVFVRSKAGELKGVTRLEVNWSSAQHQRRTTWSVSESLDPDPRPQPMEPQTAGSAIPTRSEGSATGVCSASVRSIRDAEGRKPSDEGLYGGLCELAEA
jgi:hypothetical protein